MCSRRDGCNPHMTAQAYSSRTLSAPMAAALQAWVGLGRPFAVLNTAKLAKTKNGDHVVVPGLGVAGYISSCACQV